jgi:hypothetical protein
MTRIKKTRNKAKGGFSQEALDQMKADEAEYAATGRVELKPFDLNRWQSKWDEYYQADFNSD